MTREQNYYKYKLTGKMESLKLKIHIALFNIREGETETMANTMKLFKCCKSVKI